MKKIRLFLPMLALAFVFMACNTTDRQIDNYEKAMKAGEYEKAEQILNKIDESKLTSEQRGRLLEINLGCASDIFNNAMDMSSNAIQSALGSIDDDVEVEDED